jgi:hypothetical protein
MILYLYLLGFITLLVIIYFLYIRLKYRFWVIQPVYHYYNIYYWLFNKGIINITLPEKNKYTNIINIETFSIDKLTNKEINDFILLVRENHNNNNNNNNEWKFIPKHENIIPYFYGYDNKCFISFYSKPNLLYDTKNNNIIEDKKIIGAITSRPLLVSIIKGKNINKFTVYFMDYLCVNKFNKNQNIENQLIQTHEYNQRYNNRNTFVSLLKIENKPNIIVPLTTYNTYYYSIHNWKKPLNFLSNIKLLTCDSQNIYYLYNFLKENIQKWSIIIIPEISNLLELIKSKNIFVKMLVYNTEIVAFYIFKRSCIFINKEKQILTCIASMNGSKLTNNDFIEGFFVSLWSIKDEECNFQYLQIENISNNNIIINNISNSNSSILEIPISYYFYNFAYESFKSEKVLIIN